MIHLIKRDTRIDFLRQRRIAYIISAVFICVSMAVFLKRGDKNFGIDFTGGLIMERKFTEPVSVKEIREILVEVNLGESVIQDSEGGTTILIRTEKGVAGVIDAKLKSRFRDKIDPDDYLLRTDMVGPSIGRELRHKAALAVIFSWVAIIAYVTIRYKFRFAIAGVAALIHDVLVAVGAFAISGREINYPVIAALLVIVGYSINDTIVIYDRIRENMKLRKGDRLVDIFNLSINQTLGRTILTTFATVLSVGVLFIIGGAAINDFAFALLIGMVSGIYSTIYIACALVISGERLAGRA